MSLSDCPKCWDTPCTCGHEWHNPNYQAILRSRDMGGPGTPSYRLDFLITELAKRFPDAYDAYSSMAPESKFLDAIDNLVEIKKQAVEIATYPTGVSHGKDCTTELKCKCGLTSLRMLLEVDLRRNRKRCEKGAK